MPCCKRSSHSHQIGRSLTVPCCHSHLSSAISFWHHQLHQHHWCVLQKRKNVSTHTHKRKELRQRRVLGTGKVPWLLVVKGHEKSSRGVAIRDGPRLAHWAKVSLASSLSQSLACELYLPPCPSHPNPRACPQFKLGFLPFWVASALPSAAWCCPGVMWVHPPIGLHHFLVT